MKIKKWKKIIFAAALLAVLVISGISALFTDGDTMLNVFTVGKVDIKLLEPNWTPDATENAVLDITPRQEIAKDPQISNIGNNDAYVFMEVVVPYANITTVEDDGGNEVTADTPLFSYDVKDGWVQVGDTEKNTVLKTITRRYAYGTADAMTVLPKNGTTNALFDYIRFANVVEDQGLETTSKDVVVNAYAIQTDNINDGKILLDGNNADGKVKPADIWEVIFNQKLVNYTPLEYIESTGTQYIDTGFKPNQDTRVVCDFKFTGVKSEDDYHLGVFGARQNQDSSDAIAFALGYRYEKNKTSVLRSDYNSGYIGKKKGLPISPENLVNTRFTVDKDNNFTTIDGTQYSDDPAYFSVSYPMYLFAFNSGGEVSAQSKLRMYSCKIYDDGKMVRDFRPCINSEGKVGMYDAVTKQFYGPAAGTDEFIAGQYVLDDYVHDSANLILDGIWNSAEGVHSDTLAAGWVDLSGNCQPTPLGTTNTVGTNCITGDGTAASTMTVLDAGPINLTTFTLEFIFKPDDDNGGIALDRNHLKSYYINSYDNDTINGVFIGNGENRISNVTEQYRAIQVTCDGTSAEIWLNGVKKITNGLANAQSTDDKLILFNNRYSNNGLKCSIYAVRIHNRVLTDEELAQNYEVDKKRFGL